MKLIENNFQTKGKNLSPFRKLNSSRISHFPFFEKLTNATKLSIHKFISFIFMTLLPNNGNILQNMLYGKKKFSQIIK